MSVLKCPVCSGAMRERDRNGVVVDTCTQCRGVWLDRGELEKIAAALAQGSPSYTPGSFLPPSVINPQPNTRPYRRDEDDDHEGRAHHKKSRMGSFMDFFD
jgi:uncharacterized protein